MSQTLGDQLLAVAIRYALVAAFLYEGNELSVERAWEFLPYHVPGTKRGRGHPPTDWFGRLGRQGDLDTAAVTTSVLRCSRHGRLWGIVAT